MGASSNITETQEGLNLPKSCMSDFYSDLEGRLALLTEKVPYKEFGLTLEEVRKPLLVIGLPGIGKTSGIISIINKFNKELPKEKQLGFKKILLGQTVVGSLSGIPVSRPDGSVVRVQIPDLPNPERDGEYGVLFLDEVTTADEMQIQPALGLCDESRSLGEYTLPEHWIVVGAGNGPDCPNFVRLDDMTISRFTAYDIAYSYKKDFRPYAHMRGINPDIIAFLNFDSSMCVKVESTDMDEAGKMFPCPRTWERLSSELKMRQAIGKPVEPAEMTNFAGRIIGFRAGDKFSAFCMFKTRLNYSPEAILNGNEKEPEVGMAKEEFHIILQSLIKTAKNLLSDTGDGKGNYPLDTYNKVANMMNWLLSIHELENKLNALVEIRDDSQELSDIVLDEDFFEICPSVPQFFADNAELLSQEMLDNINNYSF